MSLFDSGAFSSQLPNFDVSMPEINTQSFLPNFDVGTNLFGGGMADFSSGGLFSGFSGFGNGFGGSSFYGGGFRGGDVSFKGMAPQYGPVAPFKSYSFPWDKPIEFPDIHGHSGGIGTASGGYSVLNQYNKAFVDAAQRWGNGSFDANWLKAVAMMEGGWGQGAVSGAGAIGIMQIMPTGYLELQKLYPNWKTDPYQNIMLGAAILRSKIDEHGGRDIGTERYLGVGVDQHTGISTTEYLRRIKGFYEELQHTTPKGHAGEVFTGKVGSSYLSIFGGVEYPISSQHGVHNGAPQEWYYQIDDELGIQVGAHPGLDVAMPDGTKLFMPKGFVGRVTRATGEYGYGYDRGGGVSRSGPMTGELRIEGKDAQGRDFMMIFGHMQRIYTPVGTTISGGAILGLSGTAGSGPHLHFEYRIRGNTPSGWIAVDPRTYLR